MYPKNSHIHFVGIGGISMSGIATILTQYGYTVSGCDPDDTQDTTKQLKKLGCNIYHGNNAPECDDPSIDVLVYIPMYATSINAVAQEIERSTSRGIIVISRAGILAQLMATKTLSIGVTGSHGKTTTSSLMSHILIEAQLDPTVVVGGKLKNISSNNRIGNSSFFVAEADESDRSFLQLFPSLAIITNIDTEHLETYTDLDDIKNTFAKFIRQVGHKTVIVCKDDAHLWSLFPMDGMTTISYGFGDDADFYARDIMIYADHSTFTVYQKDHPLAVAHISLPLAGTHNIYNCLATIALAHRLNIPGNTISKAIASFAGVERRFSFWGMYKNAEIFDDYGHHPKEIEHTLTVARKRAKNKLIVVFQPHRYTRTAKLWNDFLHAFHTSCIDTLIITDIYSAGEFPIETITSSLLIDAIQSLNPSFSTQYVPFEDDFAQLKDAIERSIQPDDLILFLGAGKMHHIASDLTNNSI
jgi:UDP-N-acetylmuramate--alanine ligase